VASTAQDNCRTLQLLKQCFVNRSQQSAKVTNYISLDCTTTSYHITTIGLASVQSTSRPRYNKTVNYIWHYGQIQLTDNFTQKSAETEFVALWGSK